MSTLAVVLILLELAIIGFLLFRRKTSSYDGNMVVYETDDKKTFSLEIETPPDKMSAQKDIRLRVTHAPE
jgi:hypothetical protein